MNCFFCDQPMVAGSTRWVTYGKRNTIACDHCDIDDLTKRALALGCFAPYQIAEHTKTVQELYDAIAAEVLAGEWLARVERLPEAEQQAAVHRLRLDMEADATPRPAPLAGVDPGLHGVHGPE